MSVKLSQVKAKAASKLTKTCLIVSICCFVFFLIGIGSGLYSASVLNKPTPTPVAVKRFQHLYQVEGSLENEIKGKVVPKVKDIADDTVQIVNEMVSRLVRHERSIGSKPPSKIKKFWKKSLKKMSRPKRELLSHFAPENLDPIQHTEREGPIEVDDQYVRSKRRALEELRQELQKCRQVAGSDCRKIYEKMSELTVEIDQRFAKMKSIVNELRPGSDSEKAESGYDEHKEAKRKMKEEKKLLKQEMKQKLQEQGLRDCSSEEMIDGDMSGCATNIKDVFENDTNIIHTKTKIYAKPSTIAVSTSTESGVSSLEPIVTKLDSQSSSVATSTSSVIETSTEFMTPRLPDDNPEASNSKSRAVLHAPPPSYRNRHGYYIGHQPPPNDDLDSHLTYNKYTKTKPDGLYRNPLLQRGYFMNHNRLDDEVETPAIVQADINSIDKPVSTTSTTTQAPEQPKIMGAHGTLLSVCEQFARQNPNGMQLDPSGTILSNNGNFQARPISSVGQQQQLPQTGQSSKASAQFFVNPGFNQIGVPLCYMSQLNPMPPLNQWYGNYYGHSSPQMMGRGTHFPGNQFAQVPFPHPGSSYPNYGRNLMPSGPSQGNYYCAFMPQANHQIPGGFGAFRTSEAIAAEGDHEISVTEHTNVPSESDIIYASFTNKPVKNMTEFQQRANVKCEPGTIACAGTGQCIETSKWCDSRINCFDASDEVACSCKARLPPIRICDGVTDCPLGDDELGCNGCDKFSFTCYNSRDEFDAAHGATTSMCFTINDRCDGIRNCLNGKDEKDCNVIVKNIGGYLSHQVSYTDGFLYRNFKGKWYPVCKNPQSWAKIACDAEVGHTSEPPRITKDPNSGVVGPFISNKGDKLQDPMIEEQCDAPTYVTCPQIKCGRVKNPHDLSHAVRKRQSGNTTTSSEKETVSIVGGSDCFPHQWPFIVAIFKNGKHHCGGAIKSQQWIVTAAHCFHSYHKNYYEVRAGALRHRSYNPEVQISTIIKVFVHPKYDQKAMVEDLALVKIANPLNYNRYVRPICMPAPGRSGSISDWRQGPPPGTLCTVMGWGTLAEDGPHPDGLKEVHLPILSDCKNNNRGKAICAGETAGGRDACQGDSGGPLLCKSLADEEEWYLAGVVSHGEGCAREGTAGIYTRISLYLEWLDAKENEDGGADGYPISTCTGFKCIWGGGKCLPLKSRCNGIVECLGGEDEVDCQFTTQQLRSLESNQFRAASNRFRADDDPQTTTMETRITTVIDTTILPPTSTSTSPVPETTVETTISPTSPTTTSSTVETQTETETVPETTQSITTPSTVLTIKTSEETPTTPTSTSTSTSTTTVSSTSLTTSRDGRQLVITTASPATTESARTTNDSGRFLFPSFAITTSVSPVVSTTITPTQHSTKGFVPIPIDSTTKKPINNRLTIDVNKGDTFHCKNIPQSINQIHRCDKQTDCEDGTDEVNCTCREFLIHQQPHKICDGIVDCIDLTDEEGCLNCDSDQFKCRLSKTCVNLNSRCDRIDDCLYKEDELDCITLTNGTTVLVTPDYNPVLKNRGYLTHNHKGKWTIHCDSDRESTLLMQLVGQTCISLGFAGYTRFDHIKIGETGELNIQIVPDTTHDTRKTIAQEQVSLVNMKENMVDIESVAATHDCVALWIECVPHKNSNKTFVIKPTSVISPVLYEKDFVRPVIQPNTVPHVIVPIAENQRKVNDSIGLSEYQWPFSAVVFAEGKPICNGILVSRQWVMVEATCLKLYRLEQDHIAVLLGSSNSFLHIQGPYEIVTRVDCVREIPNTNALLLHLDYPVYYNRYILPTYLIASADGEVETEECLTVSIDKFGRLRSWPVRKTIVSCPGGYKCFEQLHNDTTTLCELKDYIYRPGYVLCRTESSSWFPTGFYHDLDAICSPDKQFTVLTLNPKHFQLLNVIETLECPQFYGSPLCHGHRCPFGVCLPEKQVCDGVVHCHDASDEAAELCVGRKKRKCNNHEVTCRNGHCVEKSRFCDQINDCGDYTDEPAVCSCLEYLKVTDPNKICDGVRNCLDKSDENNDECRCNVDRFRCGQTLKCIPHDFVCDTDIDCPGGEDEMYCYGIQDNHFSDGYYEVMQQEFGIWHTKCFPKSKPPTEADLIEICKKMGYIEPINPKARARVDNDTVMAILPSSSTKTMELIKETDKKVNGTDDEQRKLPPPTKAIIYNKFSTLQVNKDIKLYVKPSRPLARLVEWDKNDEKNCFRVEINCS